MTFRLSSLALTAAAAVTVSACADGSTGLLSTSAITPASATQAAKMDPACVALSARIDTLRKEGVVERVEKVSSTGTSKSVTVKRESLTKLTELDRANAEFQQKCSVLPASAAAPAPAPGSAQAAAASAGTAPAKKTADTATTAAATTAKKVAQ